MTRITELEQEIRDLINAPRKHRAVREDAAEYHKLCSCLDVIGDTELAFHAHEVMSDDPRPGSSYLVVYGFLQALVLQQDAVRYLYEALGLSSEPDPALQEIREIRNDAVGHPTNRRGGKSFSHISRPSMGKGGFELMTFEADQWAPMLKSIRLKSLRETQQTRLEEALALLVQELRKEEIEHREQFRDEKLAALFPPVLSYHFEKVSDAAQGSFPFEYGAVHLGVVSEVVGKVRTALERRRIDGAYPGIEHQLERLEYPLAQLREYFEEKGAGRLNSDDAQVFTSFVRAGMSKLQEMARELDDEYGAEP